MPLAFAYWNGAVLLALIRNESNALSRVLTKRGINREKLRWAILIELDPKFMTEN